MACTQPVRAWQAPGGGALKWREPENRKDGTSHFRVPCGNCLSCRLSRARDWAIRCSLEQRSHTEFSWCTLTYDEAHLPKTLQPDDLSGFIKRLRANLQRSKSATNPIRYFGCGEYGEQFGRPHYHCILYGTRDAKLVEKSWRDRRGKSIGITQVDELTPAAIAYVAGYCTKKAVQSTYWRRNETFDPDTGEVLYEHPNGTLQNFRYQPPFLRMSRNPGIGADAKERYRNSWRSTAIWHGKPVPAPRTFRDHWKDTATDSELLKRQGEIDELVASLGLDHLDRLRDAAKIALSRHQLQSERRKL